MKKISVIFMVVFVFILVSFANGQDCGKCPLKCKSAQKTTVEKEADPVVYVKKDDKIYHQKDCTIIKNKEEYKEMALSLALKEGLKPCSLCNPPKKSTDSQKASEKKKENN